MATARISQEFADDSAFQVEVEVSDEFPDSVAEVCAQAIKLWAAAFTEAGTE